MEMAIETAKPRRKRKPRKTEFGIMELAEDIRQEVLDKYRSWNVEDDNFWAECPTEDLKEKAKENGFEINTRTQTVVGPKTGERTYQEPTIYWRGFSSQGDGAFFEASVDLAQFVKANAEALIRSKINIFDLRKIVKGEFPESWSANIKHFGYYSHSGTMGIEAEWDGEQTEEQDKMLEQIRDYMLERARELADEFYKALEAEYDYQCSDEGLIETFEANDRKFTRDGEMI
jgi:hypothetical protein